MNDIKYILITPKGGNCVSLFDTMLSAKKSLTHAVNSLATAKEIERAWQYFEHAGWRVQKIKIETIIL